MPITDPVKLQIAQKRLLDVKICRKCGARNPRTAERCRKCRSSNLRLKKRSVEK
ncbi:MAG: 50S ribosomal protein L40e [Candidatus Nezhaarchaeota archaeon]|nr:50S ribosomal protein L40e [Candidatus Nezhaarchaeota archaeon]